MLYRLSLALLVLTSTLFGPFVPAHAARGAPPPAVAAPLIAPRWQPPVAFAPGNLVVLRVGDGSGTLSNASAPVFLDEYTPAGVLVQSVAVPTTAGGGNGALTLTGNSTTEGGLGLSANGQFLTLGGYYTGTGQLNPGSSVVTRTVARVNHLGAVDTTTFYTDTPTAALRSAISNDGAQFWTAGGSNAVRYLPYGNTGTSTQIITTPTNLRQLGIYNGQLYLSSSSGAFIGVSTVGTGLPTTPNQPAVLQAATTNQPNGFLFLDRDAAVAGVDTLYIANQTATNGLQKFSYNGSTWSAQGSAPGAFSAVTGYVSGTTAVMYVLSGTAASNILLAFTDAAPYTSTLSGTFISLTTASTNTAFRGLAFAPIAPPPATDLSIAKFGPTTVAAGTLFTYTLALTNLGPNTGTNTIITDVLPSEVMFITYTTGLSNVFTQPSANVLQWNLGDWPAGNGGFIGIQAMTYASVTNGTLVTNTAVITSSTAETITTNNISNWPLTVNAPVLSIGKAVEPNTAVPYHGVVTYTVILTNTGGAEANSVLLTDVLPTGTAFGGWVQQPVGAMQSGNALNWNGTVSATNNITLVFTATHTGNFEDVITNTAQFGYFLGSGSASATFSVVSAGPNLDIVKTVTPNVNVPHNGPVTYTINLKNLGMGSATGVMLTDVLPVSTTFSTWITQPVGASESGGTLTWTGDVPASSQVDFVFVVDQNYPYGATAANTVVFEHESGGGDDTATFDVEPLYAVNFRYNDVEDVVLVGEEVYLAGSFNGWNTNAFSLTANPAYSMFSGTLILPAGTYQYKYVVKSGGDQWDWLNTNDRTVVVSDNITVEDYRNVVVGWANLNGPAAMGTLVNIPTAPISGQVYINNVTNPAGPGRGVRAQVGYGNAPTPASWAWANTVFDSQIGNNDVWRGTLTPTVTGVFSYATRYDGNWGVGNPNAGWAYGDLNGAPFSVDQAGVLTVTTLRIHDVQSTTHYSPYSGTLVSNISGIVTAKHTNGFYVQDPNPDADPRTSEAIFYFNTSAPAVNVGDMVAITGTVVEFISGSRPNDLPLTEIGNPGRAFSVISSGNALPAPILLGNGGLTFITQTIADNRGVIGPGSAISNPTLYGIDFYEALEGMRLQINNAVVVGPTDNFSQSVLLADNGVNATGARTPRGGILYTYADPQPERLMIDDEVFKGLGGMLMPLMHVSATIPGPIVGVLDYQFSTYRLQPSQLFTPTASPLTLEVTALTPTLPNQLLIAGFNVENLAGTDPQAKFDTLADFVVNRLHNPDILSLQEIQDNNGITNDGTVTATLTISRFVTAITALGGPTYTYREVTPANNQDGGAPGGNIRVGFLFRTDRGLTFVDRPGAVATTSVTATVNAGGVQLNYNPGRIDPTNIYFADSRKPLVGEFMYGGQKVFVIGNHFNSKSADQPLFGRFQPPTRSTEISRTQQAIAVNSFVSHLRALDPNVNVVVLGDINDFEFSPVMTTLKGDDLFELYESLPVNERYSYVFEGNSQSLDHILVSNNLSTTTLYDPVHASAEFAFGVQVSDHDPDVALITVPQPNLSTSGKTVNATTVAAGQRLTYTLSVINTGGGWATFNLTDTLSAQLTLVSAGGMTANGQTLTATGTLAGGAQQAFTVVVQVSASFSGTLSNTATLTGDGQLRTLTAPNVTVSQQVPNLSTSSKTVNTTTVAAGQLVTYTLVVNNTGNGAATYTLTDTLNANLTVVSAGGMTANGQTLTATGTLAAGAQMTYTVVVRVNIGFSGPLTNTATLVGDGTTRALTAPTVNVTPTYITYLPRVTK